MTSKSYMRPEFEINADMISQNLKLVII